MATRLFLLKLLFTNKYHFFTDHEIQSAKTQTSNQRARKKRLQVVHLRSIRKSNRNSIPVQKRPKRVNIFNTSILVF